MKKISIIVPCYNEEKTVHVFYEKVREVLLAMPVTYELIFVDDGSSDGTLKALRALAAADRKVTYLSFSRNFGKESAMYAGFCHAKGDYVAVMDVDLQDPPSLLPEMFGILEGGKYDCAAARRSDRRGEPPVRSAYAKGFYKLINRFSDADIVDGARDFRLMSREMADAVARMTEYNRFSKGIFGWVGFRTFWIPYKNTGRVAGESKWSFWKLTRYAMDGVMNFSQAPLTIASLIGFILTVISFIALIFIVVRKLAFGDPVAGWASTICVIVFIGGIQLAVLGLIGQYLAKTYMETKNRPHYIVSESNRDDVIRIR